MIDDESEDEGLGSSIRDVYDTFKDVPSSDIEYVQSSGEDYDIAASSPAGLDKASRHGTSGEF